MSSVAQSAIFADLVFNEEGERARVVEIGGVPHYAVPDGGFLRHVEARLVDRQIVFALKERFLAMEDAVIEGLIQMLGEEGPFTRAAIKHAIENMDQILESGVVNAEELRTALWMTKFRAVVDVHGDLVRLELPGMEAAD